MHTRSKKLSFISVFVVVLFACSGVEPSLFPRPTPTPTLIPFPAWPTTELVTGEESQVTWSGDLTTWPEKVWITPDGGYAALHCDGEVEMLVKTMNHLSDVSLDKMTSILSDVCESGTLLLITSENASFATSWSPGADVVYQDFTVNGEIITTAYRFTQPVGGEITVWAYNPRP